jgi:D-alanyl-D-alanine carboxypeptidase (penicillin-binding protein 5/6)
VSGSRDPDDFSELAELFGRATEDADRIAVDPQAVAAARRRRRRRRIAGLVVVAVIVAAVGTYLPLTLLATAPGATLGMDPVTVAKPAVVAPALPPRGESAVSVLGADAFEGTAGTNGILASNGGNGALPIASISKLITALVVLDAKPIGVSDAGPTLVFDKADHDLYDKYYVMQATVVQMDTGSRMSEHDALNLMLVASACNYADAVSTWAFGSPSRFLAATKTWLAKNGLTGTRLVEPTGVDPHNVSTPSDLLAIGKLALANPLIAATVAMQSVAAPGGGAVTNTNSLLHVDGITGIKTGTLDQAGSCLLFSAVMNIGAAPPITVIGIVLGGESREGVNADARAVLASVRSGFHEVPLLEKGQVLGSYTTPWKDDAQIVAGEGASVLTWSDTPITSTVKVDKIATGASGTKVGAVTFVGGKSTVVVPLVLRGSIAGPDGWWRIGHPGQLLGK